MFQEVVLAEDGGGGAKRQNYKIAVHIKRKVVVAAAEPSRTVFLRMRKY